MAFSSLSITGLSTILKWKKNKPSLQVRWLYTALKKEAPAAVLDYLFLPSRVNALNYRDI